MESAESSVTPGVIDPLDALLREPPRSRQVDEIGKWLRARWPLVAVALLAIAVAAAVFWPSVASVDSLLPRADSANAANPANSRDAAKTVDVVSTSGASTTVAPEIIVHVAGAVASPGVVRLPGGSRVNDAVGIAGGPLPTADLDQLNLAALLVDGDRVFVPQVGATPPPTIALRVGGAAGGSGSSATPANAATPVNINTADAAALDALPGVGPSTAAAIIAYRTEHGRFTDVEELQEVRGIGPSKFEAMRDLATVGP
jgi:competence protein ComEA